MQATLSQGFIIVVSSDGSVEVKIRNETQLTAIVEVRMRLHKIRFCEENVRCYFTSVFRDIRVNTAN